MSLFDDVLDLFSNYDTEDSQLTGQDKEEEDIFLDEKMEYQEEELHKMINLMMF